MEFLDIISTTVVTTDSESLLDNATFEYQNATQSVELLRMCPDDSFDRCASGDIWRYIVAGLNVLSLVVNIFHIIMLQKLPVLRGTTCLLVLHLISVSDLYALLYSLKIFCFYHHLYYEKNIMIGFLFASLHEHSGFMRYNGLAIASIERFLCLCHPRKGNTVCFKVWSRTQIIKALMAGFCIGSLVFSVIKNYFFRKDLCLWALYGPATIGSSGSSLCIFSYILFMTVIIVVCNAKVLIKLRRVRSQNLQHSQQQRSNNLARRGFFYVMIVNIVFYICLIPTTVLVILGPLGQPILKARWAVHLTFSFYGILNVFIYGWILKPYRTLVRNILTCSKNLDLDQPDVSTKSSQIDKPVVKEVFSADQEQSVET